MVSYPESDPSALAPEIRRVLVLGGSVAGLLAALALKRLRPELDVSLVRGGDGEPEVEEGTNADLPGFLFDVLGISKEAFHRVVQPVWKQGTRFLWGPRDEFFRDFEFQYDQQFQGLPKPAGYYATPDCSDLSASSALMARGKAFATGPLGKPLIKGRHGFHFESAKLASFLEKLAKELGVTICDESLDWTEAVDGQVETLHFKSGLQRSADLFVDASGVQAGLIGKALAEPFVEFSLPCDRMVVGAWPRTDEPILPCTTVETMDHGWCWQIEHESSIQRGYAFGSAFASDDGALAEFRAKNPLLSEEPRVIAFRSGRHERAWVGNVVAIGDASGFVEPLASAALSQVIHQCRWLVELLRLSGKRPDDAARACYNRVTGDAWDEIRDLLAFHYKFNTRLDTPFWRHCREHTGLGRYAEFRRLYGEVGPSPALLSQVLPGRPNLFGVEGFLAVLVGQRVGFERIHLAAPGEFEAFNQHRSKLAAAAKGGVTVRQALDAVRRPDWQWT